MSRSILGLFASPSEGNPRRLRLYNLYRCLPPPSTNGGRLRRATQFILAKVGQPSIEASLTRNEKAAIGTQDAAHVDGMGHCSPVFAVNLSLSLSLCASGWAALSVKSRWALGAEPRRPTRQDLEACGPIGAGQRCGGTIACASPAEAGQLNPPPCGAASCGR